MFSIGIGATDVGNKRTNNEDAILIDNDLGLYVVCDGMGGLDCGELASAITIETVARCIESELELLAKIRSGDLPAEAAVGLSEKAAQQACSAVFRAAEKGPDCDKMGTTLTMLLMLGKQALMTHVGDSRLYIYHKKEVRQLSVDHTMAAELIAKNVLAEEAAEQTPFANALTRNVGTKASTEVDTLLFNVCPGDRLLLCSDGLTRYLKHSNYLLPFFQEDFQSIPRRLITFAKNEGGKDNISALVVHVAEGATEQQMAV